MLTRSEVAATRVGLAESALARPSVLKKCTASPKGGEAVSGGWGYTGGMKLPHLRFEPYASDANCRKLTMLWLAILLVSVVLCCVMAIFNVSHAPAYIFFLVGFGIATTLTVRH